MARKKKDEMDIRIKIALIGASGIILAGLFSSPYFDSLNEDRPIIDISLGGLGTDLPAKELPQDDEGYYLQFVSRNRGISDGKIIVTIQGENAQIRGNSNLEWTYERSVNFIIFPDPEPKTSSFYVMPDENTETFSIGLMVEDQTNKQFFQEINDISPTIVTYEKTDTGYVYIRK